MRLNRIAGIILIPLWFSCNQKPSADTEVTPETEFKYEVIADDLMMPWNLEVGPDGYLWASEQVKKVIRISLDNYSQEVIQLENFERDSFYMLGMAFHPDFSNNGLLYLSTLYPPITQMSTGYVDVFMAKYDSVRKTISMEALIIDSLHTPQSHNPGGRMKITKDEKLIVVASCEVDVDDAQDMDNLSGKILRFNLDGSIPDDNPFPNSPIYTLGHRNPQGIMIMDDGSIYISEHGPVTDDEFNKIEPGANYGWPIVRGISDTEEEKRICDTLKINEALCFWTPTIAPSSLLYYNNSKLPLLQGKFLISTLKENDIRVISLETERKAVEERIIFNEMFGRIRDLETDSDGNLYFSTANILPVGRSVYDHMKKDTTLRYDVIIKVYAEQR